MIVNLTLKPTTYKAVRMQEGVYPSLVELFGEALITNEENFSLDSDFIVNINGEHYNVPSVNHFIIIVEYCNGELSGVFASDSTDDLHRMFEWEGEI